MGTGKKKFIPHFFYLSQNGVSSLRLLTPFCSDKNLPKVVENLPKKVSTFVKHKIKPRKLSILEKLNQSGKILPNLVTLSESKWLTATNGCLERI